MIRRKSKKWENEQVTKSKDLSAYAWLSIAAAVVTIALKTGAWVITGSVGLLSDAAESVVNLVAAVVALIALKMSIRPADEKFTFGRTKAEYLSAGIEGLMIFVAAAVILVTSVERFLNPRPLEAIGVGLAVSVVASVVNGVVAVVLLRAGRAHRSVTLTADGKHLMTDVVTSAGVVIGVVLVWVTKWDRLDALVAFAVGINIIITGIRLITEAGEGLLDATLPEEENAAITEVLRAHAGDRIAFHGLRTRVSGQMRFASMHVLVPGDWTVQRGHDFVHQLEDDLQRAVTDLQVDCHLEPIEDPKSYADIPTAQIEIHTEDEDL